MARGARERVRLPALARRRARRLARFLQAREAALVGPSERRGRLVHVVHVRVVHPTLKRVLIGAGRGRDRDRKLALRS